ncbi:hypothetical protein [uncultured Plantibacter sp.]|uniref:hypothetical protein n=1 Tax=uncultured Plantibacter sp. TaxID=293337 RepID=UPI0028D17E06|nr:hypothetical protein [uncultured Plantibacter sp.]
MRSLLGAKDLSDRHGWDFSYTWDDRSAGLSAELDELWQNEFERSSRATATLWSFPSRAYLSGDQRTWPAGAEGRRRINLKTGDYIVDRDGERLDWGKQLRALRPAAPVARRIEQVARELGQGEFVGVMIRAHEASHPKTKELSPVSWYERRMLELLEHRPDLRFYISCDVPAVADALVAQFPRAVTQRNKGGYNTTTGTQAAVADVYLLASSAGILRPYWSSFTTMSSELAAQTIVLEDSQSDVPLGAQTLVPRAVDPLRPWERPTAP